MLQRFTQVGEFYIMTVPTNPPEDGVKGFMDVLIYDEESDRHVKISWQAAIDACCLDGTGGAVTAATTDPKMGKFTAQRAEITTAVISGSKLTNAVPVVNSTNEDLEFKTHWVPLAKNWAALNKNGYDKASADLLEPVCIVLARPFIEHAMLSAVLAVSGGDTGATIFGPSDMQISVRLNPNPVQDPCLSCILECNSNLEVYGFQHTLKTSGLRDNLVCGCTIPAHICLNPHLFLFVLCPLAGQHLCQDDRRVRRKTPPMPSSLFAFVFYFLV